MQAKLFISALILSVIVVTKTSWSADPKPNILFIWGDDIGWSNIGIYNWGIVGYEIPDIDRIAHEGAIFTILLSGAVPMVVRRLSPGSTSLF